MKVSRNIKNLTMRDAFFDKLYELAKKDKNIIVISADMGAPSLDKFRRDLHSQFVNVGIAEANMVTIATGLALSGKKVFVYAIMPFTTSRCYEMIKVDISLMNLPVTVVGVGAGFGYDDSGPTHHCTEDITIMRVLPNMTIFSPSDAIMTAKFAEILSKLSGPSYIRLDRERQPIIYTQNTDFSKGMFRLKIGKDVCIISTGNMVHSALKIVEKLKKHSINAGVLDLYRLKPINEKMLLENIKKSKRVVSLEEHLLNGGLGSAIAEILLDNNRKIPFKRFGIKDKYLYAYGGRENIQSMCDIDVDTVTQVILKWLL